MPKIIEFSSHMNANDRGRDIIAKAVELTKKAEVNFSTKTKMQGYDQENQLLKESILAYAKDQIKGKVDFSYIDFSTEQGFSQALEYPEFREVYFSVIQRTIETVNSKIEIQSILPFANILSMAEHDSENIRTYSPAIFEVEDTSLNNLGTIHQFQYGENETFDQTRKEASFALDIYQMNAGFCDLGEFLRKLAVSFRVKLQAEICEAVFDTSTLSTPFILQTFDKEKWMTLCARISAVNGNVRTMSYGTALSYGRITDGVEAKFISDSVANSIMSNGYIANIFGTSGYALDQAVGVNDGLFQFKVPNNKIILAPAGKKIAEVLMSGLYKICYQDGKDNPIQKASYGIITSWGVHKTISQGAYGLCIVGSELL